jgi:hypothetical protein
MTLRICASSIAPDLRFGAARALADPANSVVVGGVVLRAEGCLPVSSAVPVYLRYSDRDAVIVADGIEAASELEPRLNEQVRAMAGSSALDDLSAAVVALDTVDRCFRDSGLWRGNIYLAGAGALAVVLDLVGARDAACREPEIVLRELAALELAYLFPVAGKFRSGEYDGQVQYRLNGWGRALAARLTEGRTGAARSGEYLRKLTEHVGRQRERYGSFLDELDVARQDYRVNLLADALTLPIPVLV